MPIDIPRGGDSHPIDLWMAVKQFIGEPPRRFGDDLQCPNYRVNRLSFHAKDLEVEAGGKSSDRIDVVDDIGQPLSGHARITSQPPAWRRVSLCRAQGAPPPPRDALWSTPSRRPDESGVPSGPGRQECLRHMARAVNVKLFLRGP